MDCQYASNCPTPPPPPPPPHIPFVPGQLPFTGFELFAVIGFAVACLTLALLIRYSERRA